MLTKSINPTGFGKGRSGRGKKNSTKHTEGTIIVTRSRFYIRSRWQELTIRWV